MGIIRNEMTIVHDWDKNILEEVREDAVRFFKDVASKNFGAFNIDAIDSMVSPIMNTFINQEYTFVINGDCSKLGWDISELFHKARIEWCEKHKHDVQNIIVINFGEGDNCHIVFDYSGVF